MAGVLRHKNFRPQVIKDKRDYSKWSTEDWRQFLDE